MAPRKDFDLDQIRQMLASGKSWQTIADILGTTYSTIRMKLDPEFARARKDRVNAARRGANTYKSPKKSQHYVTKSSVNPEQIPSQPRDTRNLTGRLFGDPLPGRSALDQKR